MTPVKPYPGYPGAAPATPAPAGGDASDAPEILPADPAQWAEIVPLAFPLLVDGVRLDSITLRRLTGRDVADLIIADDAGVSLNLRARAAIAGVHPAVLESLEASDGEKVAAACRPFLPAAIAAYERAVAAGLMATDDED